jgi:signal transduction histidine kinase
MLGLTMNPTRATLPRPGLRARRGDKTGRPDATAQHRHRWPWHGRYSLGTATAFLLTVGGFCALIQGPLWNQSPALAAVNLTVSMLFAATGLLIRHEPGQRPVAWALVLAGVLRSLDFVGSWNAGPGPLYDLVFGGMDRLFGAYALLRYPNFSLTRFQRQFLILLTSWMVIGRALIAVTSTAQWNGNPASSWWPALIPDVRLTDMLNYVVNAGEGVFAVTLVVLLVIRIVRTRGLDRIVITPIIVAGIAAVIAAGASAVAQLLSGLNTSPNGAYLTESAVDLAVPLAFLIAVIQRALLLRNITGLTAQITAGADVDSVRYALRSTLHDPTLDIVDLSAPDPDLASTDLASTDLAGADLASTDLAGADLASTDLGGTDLASTDLAGADLADTGEATAVADDGDAAGAGPVPQEHPDRLVEFIRADGGVPIAVVIADPALARYRGLFDAAVQTSGLALKNAQFQAQAARDKLEQVRASRARIVEAALAERRRLERDLHDGVQQHLLGLAAQLTAAMTHTSDPAANRAFAQARDELKGVLAELRDFAHGIHPAVLSQMGLAAALEEVAERLPLPVRVTAPASRAAPAVEATAYFVACEALTNAVKHAMASSVTVTVHISESQLEIEIADDGVGGVMAGGQGIANIIDRVSALDGEVTIDSLPGQGTRLEVKIPCG